MPADSRNIGRKAEREKAGERGRAPVFGGRHSCLSMRMSVLLLHKLVFCVFVHSLASVSEAAGTQAPAVPYQGPSGGPGEGPHVGALQVRHRKMEQETPSVLELESPAVAPLSDKCWVFMHLQKCGGSTVKDMLTKWWGSRFFIYDSNLWKKGDDYLAAFGEKLARGDRWNVMTGGYTEALRRSAAVDAKCQFFTMFRHPVARMVSAYFYCQVLEADVACATQAVRARDVDLLTFAKHWGNFALRQFALSFVPADDVQNYIRTPEARALRDFDLDEVASWYQLKMYLERPVQGQREPTMTVEQASVPQDEELYDMLQPAQNLIRDGYTAVGILENWNTTLQLFGSALDMPEMDWRKEYQQVGRRNVDKKNKELEAETLEKAWTDSELKKYIQLDLLLYEHAFDVFHEQARSHGLL